MPGMLPLACCRVAKPMVEALLLRLKLHNGLGGRITAELLDDGDCVGEHLVTGPDAQSWHRGSKRLTFLPLARRACRRLAKRASGRCSLPNGRHAAGLAEDRRRSEVGGTPTDCSSSVCSPACWLIAPVNWPLRSGERLTLVVNPQWQTQGQVISGAQHLSQLPGLHMSHIACPSADFGIGRARKVAERFVAAFEEVYYLRCAHCLRPRAPERPRPLLTTSLERAHPMGCCRRVRIFGDDVRIMRCYPGQWQVCGLAWQPVHATHSALCHTAWPASVSSAFPATRGQVHYAPPDAQSGTVLLSCEDVKPTFQRLIQLLKAVRGSRCSCREATKGWQP